MEAYGKQWQEVLGDAGFGKMTIPNDDFDLAAIDYGDFMQFDLDGTPRFLAIVEKMDRNDIDQSEEVAEATTISGRGTLAILEDGVVYPDIYIETVPFADARFFNFASFFVIGAPNSYINNSAGIYDWGVYTSAGPYTNTPTGFPDATAHWLAPQAPSGVPDHPTGDWYLKSFLTGVATGQYRLSVSADDSVEVYVNNVPVNKSEAVYGRLISVDLFLDSALHDLSFKITNLPGAGFGGPTGIIWSLQELNADGTLGSVVWHSAASGSALDYFWAYPSNPPGFTPGQVVDILLDEAQDRGCFPMLTYDFSSTLDSDGIAWADVIQPSFQIGADLLTAVKQLGESYFVPRMAPDSLTLHLHQSLGSASGVEFDRGDNITDLKHQGSI